jgi:hypothetical protein
LATITLGTYKGVDAYRDVMDSAGIKIRDSANEILGRPAFPYASVKTEAELALLSAFYRQGRVASRRTLSPRRLHRDEHEPPG